MQKIYKYAFISFLILTLQGCGGITPNVNDYGNQMAIKAQNHINQKKYSDAIYYLEEASKSNNQQASSWANMKLSSMYMEGIGITKNCNKSKYYLGLLSIDGPIGI